MCKWKPDKLQISNLYVLLNNSLCVHKAGFEKYGYYFTKFPFCDHPHIKTQSF